MALPDWYEDNFQVELSSQVARWTRTRYFQQQAVHKWSKWRKKTQKLIKMKKKTSYPRQQKNSDTDHKIREPYRVTPIVCHIVTEKYIFCINISYQREELLILK